MVVVKIRALDLGDPYHRADLVRARIGHGYESAKFFVF
jgi:hypothetical protein